MQPAITYHVHRERGPARPEMGSVPHGHRRLEQLLPLALLYFPPCVDALVTHTGTQYITAMEKKANETSGLLIRVAK